MKKSVSSKSRFLTGIVILLVIMSTTSSCTKSALYDGTDPGNKGNSTTTQGANEVWIQNMLFTPNVITVAAGTTITWTNKDTMAHTVTSTGAFDSGSISPNGTYSHLFGTVGTFAYKCSFHPEMTATVIVN